MFGDVLCLSVCLLLMVVEMELSLQPLSSKVVDRCFVVCVTIDVPVERCCIERTSGCRFA